jgi:hypothetical protein
MSRNIESSFQVSGIYLLSLITILSTLRMPTSTPPTTPQEILGLVEEAEAEALKRKAKKRRTARVTTPEIRDEEEEDIEENTSESESDCIIVASSRSKSK